MPDSSQLLVVSDARCILLSSSASTSALQPTHHLIQAVNRISFIPASTPRQHETIDGNIITI